MQGGWDFGRRVEPGFAIRQVADFLAKGDCFRVSERVLSPVPSSFAKSFGGHTLRLRRDRFYQDFLTEILPFAC